MNAPKFTAELKAKWIEALRSGKYSQGKTALKQDGKHCCLGVLCEFTNPVRPSDEEFEWQHWGSRPFRDKWVGADLFSYELADALATMNDRGHSFAEIATYIEANIPAQE